MTQNNIMAAVAYLFGWVSGLAVYVLSPQDKFVRFHGIQSILVSIVYGVILGLVMALGGVIIAAGTLIGQPLIGTALGVIVMAISMLLFVALILWTMWQAYNGKWHKLPLIGGFAEKWA